MKSIVISKDDSYMSILWNLAYNDFTIKYAEFSSYRNRFTFTLENNSQLLKIIIRDDSMSVISSHQFSEHGVYEIRINSDLTFEVLS